MDGRDPIRVLARRLRALREEHWPGVKVTQLQLATALSAKRPATVPLISSWESQSNPRIPPIHRLEDLATFFATKRTVGGEAGQAPRLLNPDEMTEPEQRAREDLVKELMRLRNDALRATGTGGATAPEARQVEDSLNAGLWRFEDGRPITIVCAQLPSDMLEKMPYTDRSDPDYIALYAYSDLDALFELHGHLRAANPTSQVDLRTAGQLVPDDYTAHLVSVGGVDWNTATSSVLDRLQLPVRQAAREEGLYFEADDDDGTSTYRPQLAQAGDREILREDVALFARAVNPFNRKRFVTICNGMYGSGTYGAVRALTDARFRDRNAGYLQERFGDSESYCLLSRITVENGAALTPDWTLPETRLFEWSKP